MHAIRRPPLPLLDPSQEPIAAMTSAGQWGVDKHSTSIHEGMGFPLFHAVMGRDARSAASVTCATTSTDRSNQMVKNKGTLDYPSLLNPISFYPCTTYQAALYNNGWGRPVSVSANDIVQICLFGLQLQAKVAAIIGPAPILVLSIGDSLYSFPFLYSIITSLSIICHGNSGPECTPALAGHLLAALPLPQIARMTFFRQRPTAPLCLLGGSSAGSDAPHGFSLPSVSPSVTDTDNPPLPSQPLISASAPSLSRDESLLVVADRVTSPPLPPMDQSASLLAGAEFAFNEDPLFEAPDTQEMEIEAGMSRIPLKRLLASDWRDLIPQADEADVIELARKGNLDLLTESFQRRAQRATVAAEAAAQLLALRESLLQSASKLPQILDEYGKLTPEDLDQRLRELAPRSVPSWDAPKSSLFLKLLQRNQQLVQKRAQKVLNRTKAAHDARERHLYARLQSTERAIIELSRRREHIRTQLQDQQEELAAVEGESLCLSRVLDKVTRATAKAEEELSKALMEVDQNEEIARIKADIAAIDDRIRTLVQMVEHGPCDPPTV